MSYLSQMGLVSPQADKAMWSNCLRQISELHFESKAKANVIKESRGWGLWVALVLFSTFFIFVGIRTGDYSALFWFVLGAGLAAFLCGRHYFYERHIFSSNIAKTWFISRIMMLDAQSDASAAVPAIGFTKTLADLRGSLVSQQFLRRTLLHPSSKSFSEAH